MKLSPSFTKKLFRDATIQAHVTANNNLSDASVALSLLVNGPDHKVISEAMANIERIRRALAPVLRAAVMS